MFVKVTRKETRKEFIQSDVGNFPMSESRPDEPESRMGTELEDGTRKNDNFFLISGGRERGERERLEMERVRERERT